MKLDNALEILVKAAEGMIQSEHNQSTKRMAPGDSSLHLQEYSTQSNCIQVKPVIMLYQISLCPDKCKMV